MYQLTADAAEANIFDEITASGLDFSVFSGSLITTSLVSSILGPGLYNASNIPVSVITSTMERLETMPFQFWSNAQRTAYLWGGLKSITSQVTSGAGTRLVDDEEEEVLSVQLLSGILHKKTRTKLYLQKQATLYKTNFSYTVSGTTAVQTEEMLDRRVISLPSIRSCKLVCKEKGGKKNLRMMLQLYYPVTTLCFRADTDEALFKWFTYISALMYILSGKRKLVNKDTGAPQTPIMRTESLTERERELINEDDEEGEKKSHGTLSSPTQDDEPPPPPLPETAPPEEKNTPPPTSLPPTPSTLPPTPSTLPPPKPKPAKPEETLEHAQSKIEATTERIFRTAKNTLDTLQPFLSALQLERAVAKRNEEFHQAESALSEECARARKHVLDRAQTKVNFSQDTETSEMCLKRDKVVFEQTEQLTSLLQRTNQLKHSCLAIVREFELNEAESVTLVDSNTFLPSSSENQHGLVLPPPRKKRNPKALPKSSSNLGQSPPTQSLSPSATLNPPPLALPGGTQSLSGIPVSASVLGFPRSAPFINAETAERKRVPALDLATMDTKELFAVVDNLKAFTEGILELAQHERKWSNSDERDNVYRTYVGRIKRYESKELLRDAEGNEEKYTDEVVTWMKSAVELHDDLKVLLQISGAVQNAEKLTSASGAELDVEESMQLKEATGLMKAQEVAHVKQCNRHFELLLSLTKNLSNPLAVINARMNLNKTTPLAPINVHSLVPFLQKRSVEAEMLCQRIESLLRPLKDYMFHQEVLSLLTKVNTHNEAASDTFFEIEQVQVRANYLKRKEAKAGGGGKASEAAALEIQLAELATSYRQQRNLARTETDKLTVAFKTGYMPELSLVLSTVILSSQEFNGASTVFVNVGAAIVEISCLWTELTVCWCD